MEFGVDLLRRNRFCIGKKRGRRYVCGGEAGEGAKSRAVDLLTEAIERMRRWRVWETWWIKEIMDEWLNARNRLELQLREKYSDDAVNDLLGMVDKFINYNAQFLNYWREVGSEVKRLIDDLMSGKAEVVIRGEDVSGISIHGEYVTLDVDRMKTSVPVKLVLKGFRSMTIRVPDVFKKTMNREEYGRFVNDMLRALEGGLEETDGFVNEDKAGMGTSQTWQVIVWTLLYPGRARVRINTVNVNEGSITIEWHLKSSHEPLKGKILNDVEKLSEKGLLAFMFTAILGDGDADIVKVIKNGRVYDKAVIEIAMSDERYKAWEPLLERLKGMGFRSAKPRTKEGNAVDVPFYGSNAIDLAKAMINVLPPILHDALDALGFEKWLRIRRIAEMEIKWRKGESQVIVASYGFTVNILKGTVILERKAKDDVEVKNINDALRVRYGDEFVKYVRINKSNNHFAVKIPMYAFEKYKDIKEQVIEVLRRKLEKIKDEEKKQIIARHLTRLTTAVV